jgi:Domain of unknown function (DUF5615)
LDEMYPPAVADGLSVVGIDATTLAAAGLAGSPDDQVFEAAIADGSAVLTENVADFTRLAADCSAAGRSHPGLLIALSSRFSRRPSGVPALVAAVEAVAHESLDDRVAYLKAASN